MTRPLSVLIAGHVTHDRYGAELTPGGPAYYGAFTHRALGASVRLATAVGDDFAFDAVLQDLDAAVTRGDKTTTFTNRYSALGARKQHSDAQAPAMRARDVPARFGVCDVLHLAPVMGELELLEWKRATAAGFVGVGVQGWIKAPTREGVVEPVPWTVDPSVLSGIDAACLSEEDLIGQGDLLERLVAAIPVVALTRGRNGCDILEGARITHVPALAVPEVDPTGAGDTFSAAFFFALGSGRSPLEAARLGAAAAAIVVQGRGGDALAEVGDAHKAVPAKAEGL